MSLSYLYPIILGLSYRHRGGGFFKWPSTQLARFFGWALPLWLCVTGLFYIDLGYAYWWHFLPILITSMLSLVIVGHGAYQVMGTSGNRNVNERFLSWYPVYELNDPEWKKVLIDFGGLVLVGLIRGFVTFGFLLLLPISKLIVFILIVSFSTKSIAYLIGYFGRKQYPLTEIGEFFTGFFIGLALLCTFLFYHILVYIF